jgi:hypothetical protein
MKFEDEFTTKAKKDADTSPEKKESKKVELSPDGFAQGLMLESLATELKLLRRK